MAGGPGKHAHKNSADAMTVGLSARPHRANNQQHTNNSARRRKIGTEKFSLSPFPFFLFFVRRHNDVMPNYHRSVKLPRVTKVLRVIRDRSQSEEFLELSNSRGQQLKVRNQVF